MKKKQLLKASTFYFIGNIFDKAMAFITVPIFTRILSSSDYGLASTYLSWAGILTVIISLSLGNSVRTAICDFPNELNNYISSIFTLGLMTAGLFTTVLVVICGLANMQELQVIIIIICIYSFSNSILSAIQIRYMMEVKYMQRTMLQVIPNILITVLSIVLIISMDTEKYYGRLLAYAIVTFVVALAYMVWYFRNGKNYINTRYWQYGIAISVPLIFHSISNVILSQADRTMITYLVGAGETGIYSIAYQFGLIPLVVTTTVENIWIPWFTDKMKAAKYKDINSVASKYLLIVAILCSGIMLAAPEVLKIMTTQEYYFGVYSIPPIIIATFFMFLSSVSIDLEYYLKKTRTIAANTVVAAIINILLNFKFIPQYGSIAAAFTTVTSYAISFTMHYIYSRHIMKTLFPVKIYILPILAVCTSAAVTYILMGSPVIRWLISVLIALLFMIGLYLFWKKDNGSGKVE